MDLSAIEDQLGGEDEEIAGNPLPEDRHLDRDTPTSPANLSDRQVEIIEQTADRWVAHLPPTTKGSGGLGMFALMWNGFMTLFTAVAVSAFWKQAERIEIVPVLFLSVFWLVGIGFIIGWVRMRYTRLYLLLEKDRLVIQRKLFRTTNRELMLSPTSKATLEESYAVNDVPVYSVTVHGLGRTESFGTGLPPADKEFLAREINTFLGVKADSLIPSKDDAVCSFCGTNLGAGIQTGLDSAPQLCEACRLKSNQTPNGSLWQPLRAGGSEELPESLEVDESDPSRVLISYPLFPNSQSARMIRIVMSLVAFAILAAAVWNFRQAFQPADRIAMLFLLATFLVPLVMATGILLAISRGRIKLSLSADWVQMRWGWGPFAFQKKFLPETITDCGIIRSTPHSQTTGDSRRAAASPLAFAALKSGGTPYPLVTFHGIDYGQKVVRLVRTYLKQVTGRELPD